MHEAPTCPHCFSRLDVEINIDMFYCDKPHGTLGRYEISGEDASREHHEARARAEQR